jgi:hypothetical protein
MLGIETHEEDKGRRDMGVAWQGIRTVLRAKRARLRQRIMPEPKLQEKAIL